MPLFSLRKKFSPNSFSSSLGLRKTQSTGDIDDGSLTPISSSTVSLHTDRHRRIVIVNQKSSDTIVSILRSPHQQQPLTPPASDHSPPAISDEQDKELASKLREITACDMELLLSLETQARMDVQEEKEKRQFQQRPSKVKFELPLTPPRSHSPDSQQFIYARQRRWSLPEDGTKSDDILKKSSHPPTSRLSRWSRLIKQQQQEEAKNNQILRNHIHGSSHSSLEELSDTDLNTNNADNVTQTDVSSITIGSKVKLFKRPLPLIGKVRFIGNVHWDNENEWLGIELDGRVGNTDGKVDHIRYFQTSPHCGIFVKKEDTMKVS
ncbi:hypothetical protein BD560DRAFT_399627 [Blakeslea trispora]|nr:hypothetical protein BD560DRAFT_399627 [Blakeslea trispora]